MTHDVHVAMVLSEGARRWPDRLALTAGEKEWTYRELQREVEEAVSKLQSLGIQPSEHVGIWASNLPEWVILEFALARLGAVLVTVNTALGRDDLTHLLKHADIVALFAGATSRGHDLSGVLNAIAEETLPQLRIRVELEEGSWNLAIPWDSVKKSNDPLPPPPDELDSVVNMQYTSGTTGFPKGVMLSSRNIVNNAWRCGEILGLSEEDRVLCQVPLFHCFGCVIAILASMTHGASVHLVRDFEPGEALKTMRRRDTTVVHGVPTMFQALLDHPEAKKHPIRTLRTGIMAGALCPIDLMERLIREWNVGEMTIGYGLTEASPHVTYTPRSDDAQERCQSIGLPLPETEVRLVDPETGAEGFRGELCVRGELVMIGYYKDEKATAECIDKQGWLHTGDLAERDPNGRYRIVGRLKEMILRGGENIYPAEVERVLRTQESISDVAVFGVPDDRLGEQVACAVIPKPDADITDEEVRDFLEGRIAKTKIPAWIQFVDSFPLTASGKVKRYTLRERFLNTR